jgi:hypothetical protein
LRPVTRPAAALVLLLVVTALAGGCGGDSGSTGGEAEGPAGASARECESLATDATDLRATAMGCGAARQVMLSWQRTSGCSAAAGASRSSCTVRGYRCFATRTQRGLSVGCSRPGRSLAFRVRG